MVAAQGAEVDLEDIRAEPVVTSSSQQPTVTLQQSSRSRRRAVDKDDQAAAATAAEGGHRPPQCPFPAAQTSRYCFQTHVDNPSQSSKAPRGAPPDIESRSCCPNCVPASSSRATAIPSSNPAVHTNHSTPSLSLESRCGLTFRLWGAAVIVPLHSQPFLFSPPPQRWASTTVPPSSLLTALSYRHPPFPHTHTHTERVQAARTSQ